MGEDVYGMPQPPAWTGNNVPARLRLTNLLSQAMAQLEPAYSELTRLGRRFICSPLTLTGQAPVTAWPTTTAAWFLMNNDPLLTYVFDYVSFLCVAGTPAAGGTLLGLVSKPTGTAPTAGADAGIVPANIGAPTKTLAVIAEAYTIPALDATGKNSWTQWAALNSQSVQGAAFVGGADASDAFKEGRLHLPPGFGLALTVLAAAGTTPKFAPHLEWSELQEVYT